MYRMALMSLIAGDLPGVNKERCEVSCSLLDQTLIVCISFNCIGRLLNGCIKYEDVAIGCVNMLYATFVTN